MTAPAPAPQEPRRKGTVAIGIGLAIAALGIALAVFGVANGVYQSKDAGRDFERLTRVECPGSRIVYLAAGPADVYAEVRPSGADRPTAEVQISNARTGATVPVQSASGRTYDTGNLRGRRIATVEIPASDQYLVEASGTDAETIAIGTFSSTGLTAGIWGFIGGLCFGLMCVLAGIIVLIVGLVRRARSRPII